MGREGQTLGDLVVCSWFLHKVSLVRWQRSHTPPIKIPLRVLLVSLVHNNNNNPILILLYPEFIGVNLHHCAAVNGQRGGSPRTGPVEYVDNIGKVNIYLK